MNNQIYKNYNFLCFSRAIKIALSITILIFFLGSCSKAQDNFTGSTLTWIGTWGTAQQLVEPHNMPPEPGLSNNTLRQVVRVSIGGENVRVRFSNEHSHSPAIIKIANIAVSTGESAVDPNTIQTLQFEGKNRVVIEPGSTVISDSVPFFLKPRSDVSISILFGETPPDVTGHPGSRTTSYIGTGDMVNAANLPDSAKTDHWYIIDSIEVKAPESAKAIVVIGDSITDGRGSGTNKQNRWPDVLAERLKVNQHTSNIAVLNMGIGGNCVLRACLGTAAVDRFKNDVLDQNGVKWLIILEGINDIGQARGEDSAAEIAKNLIAAYERMIDLAHDNDILVYGATLLPFGKSFYDGEWRERARDTVNNWIRTSNRFDAVIDLDKALVDPQNPTQMLPDADTGDHLHPNETGHRMMGEVINLELFINK